MPILLIIIVLALHLLLGLPLWASVLISGGGQTLLAIGHSLVATKTLPAPLFGIIGGALIGMVLAYVPMVLVFHWTGHPSW
jgi:hypothetical protein